MLKRTHYCKDLSENLIDQEIVLNGWVHRWRDHGGLVFIDLRDRTGFIQLTFENSSQAVHVIGQSLRMEDVIAVRGIVVKRAEANINTKIINGSLEINVTTIEILNKSKTPIISICEEQEINDENIRLKYRYLDLRKPKMYKNLFLRHTVCFAIRDYLNSNGFLEVETPILNKSTPEGARDYLVPSRVMNGKFFALPQSPQLFKQILMVSGIEKYFQIAKCFRDEDLRADRQPEFTQVDLEMSFVDQEDIIQITEGILSTAFKSAFDLLSFKAINVPFQRISYQEAMSKYGTDAPDLRFGLEIVDLTDLCKDVEFQVFKNVVNNAGVVRAIKIEGGADKFSRKDLDDLTSYIAKFGAKGMAWIKLQKSDSNNWQDKYQSPITKFFKEEQMQAIVKRLKANPQDLILFGADKYLTTCEYLSKLRLACAKKMNLIKPEQLSFVWVTDFPMFELDSDGNITPKHHPFTSPQDPQEFMQIDKDDKLALIEYKSQAYDIVLNGVEIGGGSIRIHKPELQNKIFEILKISNDQAKEKFGFLIEALGFGAPPHGGLALGLDRLVMLMAKAESIRDVIAFPKTQSSACPLTDAPSIVDEKQLKELGIKFRTNL